MGGATVSKSLIQFSVDRQDCVPSLLFDLRPNYGGGNEDNGGHDWSDLAAAAAAVPYIVFGTMSVLINYLDELIKHTCFLIIFEPRICCSSTKLYLTLCNPMDCTTPGSSVLVCSNSHPLSRWCYLPISSSGPPFSFCFQSFPASGSFPVNQFFTSDGQNIRASASASVLPMNIQSWFPLGLTGLIFLLANESSRVFSSTTAQKHQFFSGQPSLFSNSHICSWLLEKP